MEEAHVTNMTHESHTQRRRQEILNCVRDGELVRTAVLARRFSVSEITLRKDLGYLERRGFIRRVHGGARLASDAMALLDLSERYMVHRTAKQRIAQKAVQLINQPGLCVYLDTGSTNLLLARIVPANLKLTIITSSLSTVAALEGKSACEVIMLGGVVDYHQKILVGPWNDAILERLSFDIAFLGADSVSERGFGCDQVVQSESLRRTIARAKSCYVLADSSKADRQVHAIYALPGEITALITDPGFPHDVRNAFENKGGRTMIADESAPEPHPGKAH